MDKITRQNSFRTDKNLVCKISLAFWLKLAYKIIEI